MKNFQPSVLITFVLFSMLSISIHAQDSSDEFVEGVEGKRIYEWVKGHEPIGLSGSILAAKDGKIVVACGVGYADVDQRIRNCPSTLFEVASVTKSITAVAIMKLVQRKKIDLDGSIADYLTDVPQEGRGITIRHLLHHTSGMTDVDFVGEQTDVRVLISAILRHDLKTPPGTSFSYCNQGYAILSEIIKAQSGEDYVDFCKNEIFKPAGMASTCFTGDIAPPNCTVAIGRSLFEEKRSALEHPYGSYDLRYRGMGGVVSTLHDLWKFDRALSSDVLLSSEEKDKLFTPFLGNYAMGWFIWKENNGTVRQIATGSVRGFLCSIIRNPTKDGFVAVLCNSDRVEPYEIAMDIDKLLLGEDLGKPKPPLPVDKRLQSALSGIYRSDSDQVLEIKIDGLMLTAEVRGALPNWPASHEVICMGEDGALILHEKLGRVSIRTVSKPGSNNIDAVIIDEVEYHRMEHP